MYYIGVNILVIYIFTIVNDVYYKNIHYIEK